MVPARPRVAHPTGEVDSRSVWDSTCGPQISRFSGRGSAQISQGRSSRGGGPRGVLSGCAGGERSGVSYQGTTLGIDCFVGDARGRTIVEESFSRAAELACVHSTRPHRHSTVSYTHLTLPTSDLV